MKSWISFLLADDEYKEKKLLYFYAEGGILVFLSLIILTFSNNYFYLEAETILLLLICIFLFYVSGRYIFSGIEYTDVATEKAYKKQKRVIWIRTAGFIFIFMTVYTVFIEVPANPGKWSEVLGLLLTAAFFIFFSSYFSLKSSYKKNKELL